MSKLNDALKKTILDDSLETIAIDMLENELDSLVDVSNFTNIPVIGLIVGTLKTYNNIKDRNLLKQTAVFINEFESKTISEEKLNKYRKHLENPDYVEEECGRVMLLLNDTIDLDKSKMLARLYRAYVEEKISWDRFCELTSCLQMLMLPDVKLVKKVYNGTVDESTKQDSYQIMRLQALGLVSTSISKMTSFTWGDLNTDVYVNISSFGRDFCDYALECNDES